MLARASARPCVRQPAAARRQTFRAAAPAAACPLVPTSPSSSSSLVSASSSPSAAQRRRPRSVPSAAAASFSSGSSNNNNNNMNMNSSSGHPTRDAYLQLARVHNIFPSALLALVGGAAAARSLPSALLAPAVWAAASCSAGVAVASMAVNDYFDRAVDRRNRPDKPIPSGRVPPDGAVLFGACVYIGVLATACLLDPLALRAVVALSSTVTMLYTPVLKRIPLVKNITVASVVALAPLAGALAVSGGGGGSISSSSGSAGAWLTAAGAEAARRLAPCSVFAFFGVVYREILMDVNDLEGDSAEGVVTVPALVGRGGALATALASLAAGTAAALCLLYGKVGAGGGGSLLFELPAATASALGVFTGPVVAFVGVAPAAALLALCAKCVLLALGAARGGWLPDKVDEAVNECLKPLGVGIMMLAAVAALGA